MKGIRKRIYEASKLKDCNVLLLWQRSILNTIWYALATCQGRSFYNQKIGLSGVNPRTGVYQVHNSKEKWRATHKGSAGTSLRPKLVTTA